MKHMLGQVYSSAIVESVLVPHSKDVCILSVNLKKAWNEKSYGFDRWKWLQKVWLWKQPHVPFDEFKEKINVEYAREVQWNCKGNRFIK